MQLCSRSTLSIFTPCTCTRVKWSVCPSVVCYCYPVGCAYVQGVKCSLIPRPLSAFFTCRKKKERGPGIQSHVTIKRWQSGVALASPLSRRLQTYLSSLVFQTCLCEASEDRTTFADSQYSLLFHLCQTRVLENCACPRIIFMIRHPFYPSIWGHITQVMLDPRLPLFTRVCWKDRGACRQV